MQVRAERVRIEEEDYWSIQSNANFEEGVPCVEWVSSYLRNQPEHALLVT